MIMPVARTWRTQCLGPLRTFARLCRCANTPFGELRYHDMARPPRPLTLLFLVHSSAFTLGPISSPAGATWRHLSIGAARTVQTTMADVTVKFPGGRSATVPVGAPLSLAAYQAGCQVCMLPRIIPTRTVALRICCVQVTYQCKAGTCASCEVLKGMQPVRCCQHKVKKPLFGGTISITSKPGSATRL